MYHLIQCPHCKGYIHVAHNEINCQIFRHGVYKANWDPIPPHTNKMECDKLFNDGLIYGCSRPFRFDGQNVNKCDYI